MALQLSVAAAAATPPPAPPIGQPGCNTTCGGVTVPYPFGFGPSRCYWPGFNLTCDTIQDPPLLLLGDGTLLFTDISLKNSTVRVMRTGSIINTTGDLVSKSWNVSFGDAFTKYGYQLSSDRNELVVSGCNVMAELLAVHTAEETPSVISRCASLCSMPYDDDGIFRRGRDMKLCSSGTVRCCQGPVMYTATPKEVQTKWLYYDGDHSAEQHLAWVNVFVAEVGWVDQNGDVRADNLVEAPLVLRWTDMWGLRQCEDDQDDIVTRRVCKSEDSFCVLFPDQPGFSCQCGLGYEGNPYVIDGCQG
ncbi:unnamed protein product [Urochloa humidicola]